MATINSQGDTNINGDVIGHDKITNVTRQHIDNNSITVGNITGNTGVAIGHGAQATVNQTTGLPADAVAQLFAVLNQKVNALPEGVTKEDAQDAVKNLETEAKKAKQADEVRVQRSLEFLVETLPDAWDVAFNTILNPLAGFNTVFQKIAARVKAEKEKQAADSGK